MGIAHLSRDTKSAEIVLKTVWFCRGCGSGAIMLKSRWLCSGLSDCFMSLLGGK
jgi:hypothetical protein